MEHWLGIVTACAAIIATLLSGFIFQKLRKFVDESAEARISLVVRDELDRVRSTLDNQFGMLRSELAEAQTKSRAEVSSAFGDMNQRINDKLEDISRNQLERLDKSTAALNSLSEKIEKAQESLRQTVEQRLDLVRTESQTKLDEMRKTVDSKLQETLEKRLGESFNTVVQQLERVHKSIGEVQSLAVGVGDLKKVLTNVTVRGAFGEHQLASLLEQFLAPDQIVRNANIKEASLERVEFAVRLPGKSDNAQVLLPIDAKFPNEDYVRIVDASNSGDVDQLAAAGRNLEVRLKEFAKSIQEKYIHPPKTTDFALLFLPTEGLYAEVVRRPGLFESLIRDFHVTVVGPTTLTAFLNALQMGFRSVAIEKRSSEVWQVLGAVRAEFARYGDAVDKLKRNLNTALNAVDSLGTRTNVMGRRLKSVEIVPDEQAQALLGLDPADLQGDETEEVNSQNLEEDG